VTGFRLTEDEAWAFIAEAHTGHYTTLRKDGRPITLPVWHVVIDRAIYVRTPALALKLRRIRNDPRGYFVVESGRAWGELVAVTLAVTATIVEDPGLIEQVRKATDAKYAGLQVPLDRVPSAVRARYGAFETIRLVPEGRVGSWNNRALLEDSGLDNSSLASTTPLA
jgi:hypothetical protein